MTPSTPPPPPAAETKANSTQVLKRCTFAVFFFLFSFLSLSYAFGFFALLFSTLSIPPVSVPSQCRIVSSSVDLRTSKICELGLLNYKAKRVFYPSERRKFRCRYDYYWASIFKVEYRDHLSGQTLLALAEAPKEALPSDCRPSFTTAWLTKHKLKVNETYDCWYKSGGSKVEIFQDSYFGCQAKDPSFSEMFKRYSVLSTRMMQSLLSGQVKAKYVGWEMIAGAIGGFFTAVITIILFGICRKLLFWLPRAAKTLILNRVFFLVAYFSIVGWVAIQYGRTLGLVELFVQY